MPTEPTIWHSEAILRLRELAASGMRGSDIAAQLSFEWADTLKQPLTEGAIHQQAHRWNIQLMGRSSPFGETGVISDPFGLNGVPSFLMKEIQADLESVSFEKPKRCVTMFTAGDDPGLKTLNAEFRALWVAEAYREMWAEFVEVVYRRGFASDSEKDSALASSIPRWFRGWVDPFVVVWHWSMLFDRRVSGYIERLRGLVELASPGRRGVLSEFVSGFEDAWREDMRRMYPATSEEELDDGSLSPVEQNASELVPDVVGLESDGIEGVDAGRSSVIHEALSRAEAEVSPKIEEAEPDEEGEPVAEGWAAQTRRKPAKAFRRP